jgi:hypothetical protein
MKKDKKLFKHERIKMEKISLTFNELQKTTFMKVERNLPQMEEKFREMVNRAVELIMEGWKDVGTNGMKFIKMEQMKSMIADYTFLILIKNLK